MGIFYSCVFSINATAAALYSQNKIGCMCIILCTDSFPYLSLASVNVDSDSFQWYIDMVHSFVLHERDKEKGGGVNVPS